MNERNRSRFARLHLLGFVAAFLLLTFSTTGTAQVFPSPTPTPRRTPAPTATAPPSAAPTPKPTPIDTDIPLPTDDPNDTPRPKPGASPSTSPGADGKKSSDKLPPELDRPALVVPNIPRTRARNTAKLVELLEPLAEDGIPLEQVLVEGMGRFPVAGVAYYRDDWLHPRYNPVPHLHKGLDIFSDFGTPIRSPDNGRVARFSNDPERGGLGVYVRGSDGTVYYFAHLAERAEGLQVGQRVQVGTIIGYVGDSGNALGGTPHLHFEIRRPGHIPPKPTVDRWLDEAIELAPRWVQARRRDIDSKQDILGAAGSSSRAQRTRGELEASMLLTLLDPVGGSVGLLPRLELAPVQRSRYSSGLLLELIRQRLDGYLLAPSSNGLRLRD